MICSMLNTQIFIKIPRSATKYVIFQRTQYLFFRRNKFIQKAIKFIPRRLSYAIESLFSNFNLSVSIESFFTHKKVEQLLSDEMWSEYQSMKAYLPIHAKSILDIGSGVAAIDVLLYQHYSEDKPSIYLLDKTEMPSKVYYSFKPKGCYYNSLPLSKKLLVDNGIPSEKVFTEEVSEGGINFNTKFDLVVSLISWGFHYPVSTYLDQVYDQLNDGGALIMDVRKVEGNNGLDEIKNKFGDYEIIYESVKNTRIVARRRSFLV